MRIEHYRHGITSTGLPYTWPPFIPGYPWWIAQDTKDGGTIYYPSMKIESR